MESIGREESIFEALLREASRGAIESFQNSFRKFLSLLESMERMTGRRGPGQRHERGKHKDKGQKRGGGARDRERQTSDFSSSG
jgi:hypothetical protein